MSAPESVGRPSAPTRPEEQGTGASWLGRLGVDRQTGARLGSIRLQLVVWLLLIALVPMAVILWIAYGTSRDAIGALVESRLRGVTRERVASLERFATERIRLLRSASEGAAMRALNAFQRSFGPDGKPDSGGYATALLRNEPFLVSFSDAFDVPELMLIGREGQIVYAKARRDCVGQVLSDPQWKGTSLASAVDEVRWSLEPEISAPRAPRDGRASPVWAVGPLLEGPILAGFIAIELPRAELDRIIVDRWGLGATGEIIAAAEVREGSTQRLVATAPTRDDPHAASHLVIPADSPLGARMLHAIEDEPWPTETLGSDGKAVIAVSSFSPSFGWGISAEQDVEDAFAPVARLRRIAIVSVLAVAVNVIAIALVLAKRLSGPIVDAVGATRRIAEGDLTRRIRPHGHGEVRTLLDAVAATNDGLAGLIGRVQWSAGQIISTSGAIRRITQQQDEVARDFGASSAQIAAAVQEMSSTGRELSVTVSELARNAAEAAAAAGEGREALERIAASMQRLGAEGSAMGDRLDSICERGSSINRVVEAMTRIVNQTNLLAVNAAIEAEKAGAAGLGFQVVAREIDRLATQTAASALEIESTVESMRGTVEDGERQMQGFAATVMDGRAVTEAASVRLGRVLREVEELQAAFAQVAIAVQAQGEGVAQVGEAMARLVDGARRTSQAVEEGGRSSAALDDAAQTLQAEVSRFRLG